MTSLLESRIIGYVSKPSISFEYSIPFGWLSRISEMLITSSEASGSKEKSPETDSYLNGCFILDKS